MGRLHIGCKSKCDCKKIAEHEVTSVPFLAHQAALHAPSHVPTFAPTAIALINVLNHVLHAWSVVTGPALISSALSHAECYVIDLLAINHVQSD